MLVNLAINSCLTFRRFVMFFSDALEEAPRWRSSSFKMHQPPPVPRKPGGSVKMKSGQRKVKPGMLARLCLLWFSGAAVSHAQNNENVDGWISFLLLVACYVSYNIYRHYRRRLHYYAPPLIGGALSDDAVWRLSVTYIGPKSRTERPRKTKICTCHTWLGHHFHGQKVKVTRPLYSPPCWHVRHLQQWAWEHVVHGKLLLRCRLLGSARSFGAHGGRRGRAYRGGRPPTAF